MSQPCAPGWLSGISQTVWTMWKRGSNVSFVVGRGSLGNVLMSPRQNGRVLEKEEDIKLAYIISAVPALAHRYGDGGRPLLWERHRDLAAPKSSMIVDVALSDRAERSLRDCAYHSNAATLGRRP